MDMNLIKASATDVRIQAIEDYGDLLSGVSSPTEESSQLLRAIASRVASSDIYEEQEAALNTLLIAKSEDLLGGVDLMLIRMASKHLQEDLQDYVELLLD